MSVAPFQPPPPNPVGSTQPTVTLGTVTFLDNETDGNRFPLPIPLTQVTAEHVLPGGGKVVQLFGPQPESVQWSGTFWDKQAAKKVSALRAMLTAAKAVTLSYYVEKYSVVVEKFEAQWIHQYRCKYTIQLNVISDLSGAYSASSTASVDSLTQQAFQQASDIANDIQNANTKLSLYLSATALTSFLNTLTPNMSLLGTLLLAALPLAQASGSQVSGILGTISTLTGAINPVLTTINGALAGYENTNGIIPVDLQTNYAVLTQLLNLLQIISYNSQQGQAPTSVTVSGGETLWRLAARYYGDPTLATVIKSANNLTSTTIAPGQTLQLVIPPATATGLQ